jgi:YihY family inner membrane protein
MFTRELESEPATAPQSPSPEIELAGAPRPPVLAVSRLVSLTKVLRQFALRAWPTLKYLTQTEVHTFAFSVAANVILSFFPFIVLLMTIVRRIFHSQRMYDVIVQLLRLYLPTAQEFIVSNLGKLVRAHQGVQFVSLIMLLITSTGVFLPLEVALNRVWGFTKNRSYLGNQLMSLGLAFACGVLALTSVALTASNERLLARAFFEHTDNFLFDAVSGLILRFFAILASITIYFLIYWLLPNGKVKARWVLPAAISAGLLQEVAKYAYILALPRLDFKEIYGPFYISVSLMFWAFFSGLLLLGGAHLSAAGKLVPREDPERDIL